MNHLKAKYSKEVLLFERIGLPAFLWEKQKNPCLFQINLTKSFIYSLFKLMRKISNPDFCSSLVLTLSERTKFQNSFRGTYVTAIESGELAVSSPSGGVIKELNAGNNLIVMVPSCEQEERYATGGKENPLKIWDVEKGEKIFTAKNVRPDELQLRVPIWVNDIRFLSKSQNIVTVTGKHQVIAVFVSFWILKNVFRLVLC